MVNIPVLNRDSEWLRKWIDDKASQPQMQKRLVLVVVSVALLLDNMLYMVIVPIIPKYLRDIHAYEVEYVGYHNETRRLANGSIVVRMIGGQIDYLDEEIELGWLFASKALLQIFVNPFSGFIIDRIGYELPMIIGLIVMFFSTAIFALGRSYGVLFFARSLQGFGSAFADTSGLAMIADRFTEESERSAALGIALAFISFGCLVAPPFGSVLYSLAGKPVPFLILSFVCLIDAFMVFWVIQPKARAPTGRDPQTGERLQGTPMWRLFMDPFIAVCSGALIMANISLAFLEPTITTWMAETMPETPPWQVGMIWFPAFFPHVLGVYATVQLLKRYPQQSWLFAAVGLCMEGVSCLGVPFMGSVGALIIPLSTICFGIALVDTSLLPLLGNLVDTRHVSVYGSVYAIADISYSLAYAFGPIIAGGIVNVMGFLALNIIICVLNLGYSPLLGMLRKAYSYETIDGAVQSAKPAPNAATTTQQPAMKNGAGPERPPPPPPQEQHVLTNNWGADEWGAAAGGTAAARGPSAAGYQQQSDFGGSARNPFAGGADPLNPQWSKEMGAVVEEAKAAEEEGEAQHWYQVNLFWLPEMYLRQRLPLPLNFNPAYIFPRQQFSSPADQTDYAAWLVRGLLDFKERVDSKLIARETIADRFAEGKTAQMCMDQYERILNCYREPREGLDVHQDRRAKGQQSAPLALQNGCTEAESELTREHIVVLCQRQPYVLFTKRQAIALSAPQIAQQLARIRTAAKNRHSDTVHAVGGASVGNRDRAAQFWTEMEKAPANRRSLALVRSAVFVLCLDEGQDEELASLNGDTLTRMEGDGLQLLHGNGPGQNGLNRWFDATIQLVVSSNGCCGLCIEHSVAEGIVIINMAEEALRFAAQNWKRADKQTHKTDAEEEEEAPRPLCWALGESAIQLLGEQIAEFDSLAKDVQLRVLVFTGFGKGAIKGWHVSPDGFVQLVMQLAHFQLHGRLVSTYESATMRRFRLGRVDNIRAATPEALAWTKAMADPDSSNAVRKELFTAAARKQALITRENVTGQGIDNHLCALEVLSRENGGQVPELFREPAWTETMRFPLTTSQVSTSPEFVDCYLCYGPVVPDGYGCAYNVQQHQIIFAVSAWKSDDRTRADDFRRGLGSALAQTREMLERQ